MVRIRLRRVGAKKQPHYRVVIADQRSPRDGRHIETIGFYNPRTEPETIKIKEDRALFWLSQGAQPSDVVRRWLEQRGTMDRLARLKAGEELEALVAEYETGVDAPETPEPIKAETEPPTTEADLPEAEAEMPEVEAEGPAEEPEAEAEEPEAADEPVEASEDED
jgi:small subunit ribosomal protein S16